MPNEPNVQVLLGSGNLAKKLAAHSTFAKMLNSKIRVLTADAPSKVSQTPFGDEEAITGCENRLSFLRSHPEYLNSDYLLALEGAIQKNQFGTFIFGWAIVEDTETGRQGRGCSAKVEVPPNLSGCLTKETSLSEAALKFYGMNETATFRCEGTNGIITNGLFNRQDEFGTAIRCALGYLLNGQNYQEIALDIHRESECTT